MSQTGRLADIFGRRRFDIRPGTARITSLLSRIGNPEREFRSIHVVGTNGKGSTAAFLSSVLTAAGYRTGMFTSPHLINYRERFRVDGKEVDEARLDSLVESVLKTASEEDTFFELTTALACSHFADSGVDIAVMEAGMGGRADATAAISAIATVITPVSFDHTRWLGDSLQQIAAEKIAIAEPGTTVVSSLQDSDPLQVIENHCRSNGNRLLLAGSDFTASSEPEGMISFSMGETLLKGLRPGIPGRYQIWNAATAIAASSALETLGITVDSDAISAGLSSASWPGRMQSFFSGGGHKFLVDGAHNLAGARALSESIQVDYPSERIILLLGMMEDKDISGTVDILKRLSTRLIAVAPAQNRAASPAVIAGFCEGDGRVVHLSGTVAEGIDLARGLYSDGDIILVTGSLFVAGAAIAALSGMDWDAVRG